ncbi:MAG: hypothetical protein QOH26_1328, partial [Actinomycetota bacterium]|nr:hypothetical protein [Actinomycetota bacterium]
MEADISGSQRKVLSPSVRPAKSLYGESGIPIKDGKTLPFVVTRSWSAPEGYYAERWFLINPT